MAAEYVFDNKDYDFSVRNLKATMFDIVASEEAKIAALQERISSENNEVLQARLIELLSLQSSCLGDIVRITNSLVETTQQLDSYSSELKKIDIEIINNKLAAVDNVQDNSTAKVEEVEASEPNYQQSESPVEQVDETISNSYVVDDNSEQVGVEQNVSEEKSAEEEPTIGVEVNSGENEMPQNSVEMETPATEPVIAEDSTALSDAGIFDNSVEEVSAQAENNAEVSGTVELPQIISEDVAITPEPAVAVGNDVGQIEMPQISADSEVVAPEEVVETPVASEDVVLPQIVSSEDDTAINNNSIEGPVESNLALAPADANTTQTNTPITSDSASSPMMIMHEGDNLDRAILVTEKQGNNLRNSRSVQEQIVSGGQGAVSTEQQLISNDNGDLQVDNKKKEIESMLEQANTLYKQGNVDEAQALYDEISRLNKELQSQEQKVLVA